MNPLAGQPRRESGAKERRQAVLVCVLLALAVAAVYWPARHFEFLNYDDQAYVTENASAQRGLSWTTLAWAFSRSHSSGTGCQRRKSITVGRSSCSLVMPRHGGTWG